LAPVTAYRRYGATDAYLMGALRVHGASTARVDLRASWTDPTDDGVQPGSVQHQAPVDELALPRLSESYLTAASGQETRLVGYYDPEHDQIAFVRAGDWVGRPGWTERSFENAAPRHQLGDTQHHRVTYTAVATSRFQEYFAADVAMGFTRTSDPVMVDVPASAPPLAPEIIYVVPTFGWQRQIDTNLMRSVRFGGGLRVYLDRPWFSSGEGELLGVSLWSSVNHPLDRDSFKPFITEWGMDPIWRAADLSGVPSASDFPDAVAVDYAVQLEGAPGPVDVVGFEPRYDDERGLWFADLTLDTPGDSYMPFVRLALVRYQPCALSSAKVSRAVLTDFAQLPADRTATVTCDPYHPNRLRIAVSGAAPYGAYPPSTRIVVRVQRHDPALMSDLAWSDALPDAVDISTTVDGRAPSQPDIALWAGAITFGHQPKAGEYRLLIEEREDIPTYTDPDAAPGPRRIVYAEIFDLDGVLLQS
jgi:hypothetical protein